MKNLFAQTLFLICLIFSLPSSGQFNQTWHNQVFYIDTSSPRMSYPWEIVYGPDDSLWITEARNYLITKMHPGNYGRRTILNLSSQRNFSNPSSQWPQGGLMGMALHPQLLTGKPYVYVAFVYHRYPNSGSPNNSNCSGATGNNACYYKTKIVRYTYNLTNKTLGSSVIVLDDIAGSNDHNSGRLTIGPDLKLYYTVGDMGAGQFNNTSRPNNAQNPDIYEGKILRLNTEIDSDPAVGADPFNEWIPNDNPFTHSTTGYRLATYSRGHRNAQGIVWGNVNGTNRLFSSEHGDKSDDEVNLIESGRNYGWPKVAGACDNNYNSYDGFSSNNQLASNTIGREDTFCNSNNVKEPLFGLLEASASEINAQTSNIYTWHTIAPSSIDFYDKMAIPGWDNSLLVTSLKYGMFRLKLNALGNAVDSSSTGELIDTIPYFHGYRMRDVAISPGGDTLFFIIDSTGSTSGPTGGFSGSNTSTRAGGKIMRAVFLYLLADKDKIIVRPATDKNLVSVYPNPTSKWITVTMKKGIRKPLRVQLFDQMGRIVFEETTTKESFQINLQPFMKGMYVLKVYSMEVLVVTEKIVRQ